MANDLEVFGRHKKDSETCENDHQDAWLLEQFPDSEEIGVIANLNSLHAFRRLEEDAHVERYKCHFKLIDMTREYLYAKGVPAI